MKKLLCVMLSVAMVSVLLDGCQAGGSKEAEIHEITLSSVQAEVNASRKTLLTSNGLASIEDYGIIAETDSSDFSEEELSQLIQKHSYKNEITLKEAEADLDTLMRILKSSYGGYTYFGGDEAFDAARERMLTRMSEVYSDEPALTGYFHQILCDELSFVEDSHLMIGGSSPAFSEKEYYFDSAKNDFYLEEGNDVPFTLIENERWYISSEEREYLHLTISDTGEIVYGLFVLADENTNKPKSITLNNAKGETKTLEVTWEEVNVGQQTNLRDMYEYSEQDGVPVAAIRYFSLSPADLKDANELINQAKELKKEEIFILDIRDNMGGIADLTNFFMYNLTGSLCDFNMDMVKRNSPLNQYNDTENFKKMGLTNGHLDFSGIDFYHENSGMLETWYQEKGASQAKQSGETVVTKSQGTFTEYPNTILVLTNRNTVSAGEYLLNELSTVSNVVLVGANTNGCMVTGDVNALSTISLPNSGIEVYYGMALAITDRIDGFDSTGFLPDLVTRQDALDAAVLLANREKDTANTESDTK